MTDAAAKPADIATTATPANVIDRYKSPVVPSLATLCRAGVQAIPLVAGSLDTIIMDA